MANRLFERLSKWIALEDDVLAAGARRSSTRRGPTRRCSNAPASSSPARSKRRAASRSRPSMPSASACCSSSPWRRASCRTSPCWMTAKSLSLLQSARNARAAIRQGRWQLRCWALPLLDVANRVNPDEFDKLLTQLLAKRSTLRHAASRRRPALRTPKACSASHMSLEQGLTREVLQQGLSCEAKRYLELADLLDGGSKTEKETRAARSGRPAPPERHAPRSAPRPSDQGSTRPARWVANKSTH